MNTEKIKLTNRRKRVKLSSVKLLKEKHKYSIKAYNENCGICFLDINENTIITNCGHYFCNDCINQWKDVFKKATCPICRKDLVPKPRMIPLDNEMIQSLTHFSLVEFLNFDS